MDYFKNEITLALGEEIILYPWLAAATRIAFSSSLKIFLAVSCGGLVFWIEMLL